MSLPDDPQQQFNTHLICKSPLLNSSQEPLEQEHHVATGKHHITHNGQRTEEIAMISNEGFGEQKTTGSTTVPYQEMSCSNDRYYYTSSPQSEEAFRYAHPQSHKASPNCFPAPFASSSTSATAFTGLFSPTRAPEGDLVRHGSRLVSILSLMLLFAVYAFLAAVYGYYEVLLVTLSLLPVAILLGLFRSCASSVLPIPFMIEMFWCGACLSVLVAFILETISSAQTISIWNCETNSPSISCDLRFILVVIVGVGFVEELSKFLPLSRIKIPRDEFPRHHHWWFRIIESPASLPLVGACTAAGFSGIENIMYVLYGGKAAGIQTSIWRAVFSIPFHLACTTYASCQLVRLMLKPSVPRPASARRQDRSAQEQPLNDQPSESVEENVHQDYRGVFRHPPVDDGLDQGGFPFGCCPMPQITQDTDNRAHSYSKHVSFLEYLKCLMVPSVLHGLFDVGLFLAQQMVQLSNPEALKSLPAIPASSSLPSWILAPISAVLPPLLQVARIPLVDTIPTTSTSPPTLSNANSDPLYELVAYISIGVSLTSYILILVLTFFALEDVKKLTLSSESSTLPDSSAASSHSHSPSTNNHQLQLAQATRSILSSSRYHLEQEPPRFHCQGYCSGAGHLPFHQTS